MTANQKIKVTVMLSPDTITAMDSYRGGITRSAFLEILINGSEYTNSDMMRLLLNTTRTYVRDEKTKNGDE